MEIKQGVSEPIPTLFKVNALPADVRTPQSHHGINSFDAGYIRWAGSWYYIKMTRFNFMELCILKKVRFRLPGIIYRQTSDISHTLAGNKIVDHSDAVGASPVGAAPITPSFST